MAANIFGEFIAARRKETGKTQTEVARSIGITNAYLHDVERGARNPFKQELLESLAEVLDVPLVELEVKKALTTGIVELPVDSAVGEVALQLLRYKDNLSEEKAVELLAVLEEEKPSNALRP